MHTAQVASWGQPPQYISVPDPETPAPDSGLTQVKVLAVGLHRLVRSRAAGTHYSSKTLPHTPGVDGVGTTADGKRVYFSTLGSGGSFSEIVNVPTKDVTPLPEKLDPHQAAALVNPALSSWMALRTRTVNLPKRFSILIMGATSASGAVAVSLARVLGANRVIGCARNVAAMKALDLDQTIALESPAEKTDFSTLGDVDVILDYVYGPPAVHLLSSLKSSVPTQYVHIGSLASLNIELPGSVLRSKDLTIRGSGNGSFSIADMRKEIPALLEGVAGMKPQHVQAVPLSEVEQAWDIGGDRIVFVP